MLAQVSRGAGHLDDLDLNAVLARVDTLAVKDTRHHAKRSTRRAGHSRLLSMTANKPLSLVKKTELTYSQYTIPSAPLAHESSSHIYQKLWQRVGLPDGQLTVKLHGSAGQSLGAFGMKGLRLIVDGDANDYVGKGLSGAEIFLAASRPKQN